MEIGYNLARTNCKLVKIMDYAKMLGDIPELTSISTLSWDVPENTFIETILHFIYSTPILFLSK